MSLVKDDTSKRASGPNISYDLFSYVTEPFEVQPEFEGRINKTTMITNRSIAQARITGQNERCNHTRDRNTLSMQT